jgi:hypothetical protein
MNFKTLINNIENLSDKEKRHVLSIFQKYNIDEYTTKNNNGYFINLSKVPTFILNKIEKCVILIEKHRELIENLDNQRDSYLDYYKSLIENKLNETIEKKRLEYTKQLLIYDDDLFFTVKKKQSKCRNQSSLDVDPDLLIKEYIKSRKPKKGTVYYNILQKCNHRKITIKESDQSENGNTEDDLNVYDDEDGGYDIGGEGGDIDGGDIGDIGDMGDDIGEGDMDGETEIDDEDKDDKDDKDKETDQDIDDEYYKSDDESDTESKKENATTETGHISKNTISISKLSFYKNLLKQKHGFIFNDDRYVKMKREEYLI